ncbi:alpha/beta hydrolase [Yoonia sp.]|uniref:alpha/beta hydrolase n=1 Tax=Yoonia sp. TaxID=2212373 RepID=UPI002DF7745A|nr:alpha/beta hydrolase [Yoonia sp.]
MADLTEQTGYVFRDRHPERDEVYAFYDYESAAARRLDCFHGGVPYGPHPRERFDLFIAPERAAPLVVFFHGGYFQSLDRDRFSFIGAQLVKAGFTVAVPSYPLCPQVSLDQVLDATSRALPRVFDHLEALGRRPRHWSCAGHSAGGHIAAWQATHPQTGVTAPAACLAISGLFDLAPLRKTTLNASLELSADDASKLSVPAVSADGPRMILAFGSDETPAFHQQTNTYFSKITETGGRVERARISSKNHYTILSEFTEDNSILTALLQSS